ncbi:hypothetical protein VTN77DRAFT_9110 [Rasamsonia byssochlamydoides]|uniref:uncharacterized protein n=1 Tax=Rasamsonia byssochlamydoides TaxID=89139 RepID=UPI0037433533
MQLQEFVDLLRGKLSSDSHILTDRETAEFKDSLQRWSNIDLKVPAAIVRPASETDVITTVQEAVNASIPFVPASGGHSTWSTIDQHGFVLDLSLYKEVVPDPANNVVTVKGGVLMKELQLALNKAGQFTTVGNGNTVGVIPYFINGGISIYTPLIGFGAENIVSARVITATGDVVNASETENSDLLWAIRGAGQFFGVVIELVIRTYPLSIIPGSTDGTRQLGNFVFAPQQIGDVSCVLNETLIAHPGRISAGHFMIMTAPPDFQQQIILVAPQFFGTAEEAAQAFQPLVDLGPIQHMQLPSTFETHSDHLEIMCAKGEFKRFTQIGIDGFNQENFAKLVDLHQQLLSSCSGAGRSAFSLEWHSPTKAPRVETAFGNEHVDFWLNVLSWYTDASQHAEFARFDKAAQEQIRVGAAETSYVSYTNTSREDPLEWRYKGAERVARLRELKKKWDPTGVFTRELL